MAKVPDDITAARVHDSAVHLLKKFNDHFKLGSLKIGPGNFRFFGTNVTNHDDFSITTDADEKLDGVFEYSDPVLGVSHRKVI